MAARRVIEVQLPPGAEPTAEELDLFRGIFDAIVTLRLRLGEPGEHAERVLMAEGWQVRTTLAWSAEATRAGEREQTSGATRAEALKHLLQLVRADQVVSAP